jgi:hypothetical protein
MLGDVVITFETMFAAAVILTAGWTFLLVRADKQPLSSAFRASLKAFGLPLIAAAVVLAFLPRDSGVRIAVLAFVAFIVIGVAMWTRSALLNRTHRR